jgi:pimeloyl-ACP methyl ester carboxylesterase
LKEVRHHPGGDGLTLASLLLLAPDTLRNPPRLLWRTARDILAQDVRAELAAIRASTLIVWGSEDPLVPLAHAMVFRGEIPDARGVVTEGAGHLPMVTHPALFTRAVLAFFGEEASA